MRNRDKLLAVARTAFAAAAGPVSLEGVAREAGVGIGTLYRHFPTREDLVEAVYATQLDEVTDSAAALLRELPPDAALRAWMGKYATFFTTKRGMIDTLRAGWATGRITTPNTRERITAAIATLLTAGAETDSLRIDINPDDLTLMLLGICTAAGDAPDQVDRLLDLVMDALRTAD
ncbi:TetR/AcrR family transcriptional regulator [Nocardia sp. NBC_01388]|uniref:TetR/AcrR family transcriptional regulator n=1 Tax=Nocardia sp. NBC_01388 TaxID=2903596 RepID=UPI00324A526A